MEHPESQSTPKSKVRPLKTNDEFSSLHRRAKTLKDPLPMPEASSSRPVVRHKPQIPGSSRVFSTLNDAGKLPSLASGSSKPSKKKMKYRMHTESSKFKCRLLDCQDEMSVRISPNSIKIGDKSVSCSKAVLEYGIMKDRLWYRYIVKVDGVTWEQFAIRSADHVPFKNECSSLGIKVVNTGLNVPPIGRRVDPLELSRRTVDKRKETVFKMIESSSSSVQQLAGHNINASLNERGLYFNTPPFKVFKWDETSIEKVKGDDHASPVVASFKLSAPHISVTLGVMHVDDEKVLDREMKARRDLTSKPEMSRESAQDARNVVREGAQDVTRSATRDADENSVGDGSPAKEKTSRNSPRSGLRLGAIHPGQFYSPPTHAGSIRPVSTSSPPPLRNSGMSSSSPVRSVQSGRQLRNVLSTRNNELRAHVNAKTEDLTSEAADPPENRALSQESDTQEQKQPLKSPGRRPRRTRGTVPKEEDDLEALVEPTEEDLSLLRSEGFKRILYKFWDGRSMNVGLEDIARLNPQIYVNDTIIWFFLKLFLEKVVRKDPGIVEQILMLDTFFYFSMRNGETSPSWVKKIPLAEKHIIVMPIHERAHWCVAVIVGLDRALNPDIAGASTADSNSGARDATDPTQSKAEIGAKENATDGDAKQASESGKSSEGETEVAATGALATNEPGEAPDDVETVTSKLSTLQHTEPKTQATEYKPVIVILDSLGPTQVHHTVRKVVTVLANSMKMQNRRVLGLSDYRSMRANVPKQTNLTDCGVYLLHYIDQIMSDIPGFLSKVATTEGRVLDMGVEFWRPDELWSKRTALKRQLKEMGNVEDRGSGASTPGSAGSDDGARDSDTPSAARNNAQQSDGNAENSEDDAIEVIGMETVSRRKKRQRSQSKPEKAVEEQRKEDTKPLSPQEASGVVELS